MVAAVKKQPENGCSRFWTTDTGDYVGQITYRGDPHELHIPYKLGLHVSKRSLYASQRPPAHINTSAARAGFCPNGQRLEDMGSPLNAAVAMASMRSPTASTISAS